MTQRQISVSTVAFDGYPIETAFEEIAKIGLRLVEPAFIKGYMIFDEADFSEAAATHMRQMLSRFDLGTVAISAHMDSGLPAASEMLARRIRYTAAIGAKITITNSSTIDRRDDLNKTLESNLRLAEELGVVIALENPGNGPTNIMRDGKSGADLVRSFNSPWLRLNYDTANALTCTEGETRPETDIEAALPVLAHAHLKDVVQHDGRWQYVAIGAGELDYETILKRLAAHTDVPLTLELPLRLRRRFHAEPERGAALPSIIDIVSAIRSSWNCVAGAFGAIKTV